LRKIVSTVWLTALMVWANATAQVDEQVNPLGFSWGTGETVEHDSNFLRLSGLQDGYPVVADTLYSTDLNGKFHQTYSRQELTASATIARVLFSNLRQYDYTQEDIRANLRSDLPYSFNSVINVSRSAQLAHFADIGSPVRDVITSNDLNLTLDFPIAVDWRAVVGGDGNQSTNSAVSLQAGNYSFTQFNGGIRFQPTTGNHVDLLVQTTHATYPDANASEFINPGYRDLGADLRVDWTFSGASHLQGRAGYLKRDYDPLVASANAAVLAADPTLALNRNFAGPAYDLTYLWQVTAASSLTFFGERITGAAGDNNYLSAVTDTYRVTPGYQFSEKITLNGYLEWSHRNYFSNVYEIVYGLPPGTTRVDTTHNAGVTVIWSPWIWLQASLDAHREQRGSSISLWDYADNVIALSLQGRF
jgi:hypothetical protein